MGNFCACTSAKRTERTLNHSPDEQIHAVGGVKKGKQQKQQQQLVRFFLTGLGSALQNNHCQNPNYKLCDEEWNEIGRKAGENAMAENRLWARQIRRNVLDMFDLFIRHIEEAGDQLAESRNQEIANKINQFCEEANWEEMESELVELRAGLVDLLRDEAIRQAHKHRNKVEVEGKKLFDGCDHFMREEEIMKIFSADYQASDEDKVHSRNPTADMHTYRFKLNETRIEITDVGGQPSELIKIVDYLRNWSFHCGEGGEEATHNFILLVVSMSDFNVRHQRYEGTLLDECVSYMKVLLNNQIAQNCGLLIFFNKKDRFREKLLDADCRQDVGYLAPFLPPKSTRDFLAKGKFDERQMGDGLASKFVEAIKEMKERQKDTYCRFTCAIDTKMMEGIFGAIKDDILNQSLLNAFP